MNITSIGKRRGLDFVAARRRPLPPDAYSGYRPTRRTGGAAVLDARFGLFVHWGVTACSGMRG
jgi:hypothetical protein